MLFVPVLLLIKRIRLMVGYRTELQAGAVCFHYQLVPGICGYFQPDRAFYVGGVQLCIIYTTPIHGTLAAKQYKYFRVLGHGDALMIMPASHSTCLAEKNKMLPQPLMV